jgi:hypothetical protein
MWFRTTTLVVYVVIFSMFWRSGFRHFFGMVMGEQLVVHQLDAYYICDKLFFCGATIWFFKIWLIWYNLRH